MSHVRAILALTFALAGQMGCRPAARAAEPAHVLNASPALPQPASAEGLAQTRGEPFDEGAGGAFVALRVAKASSSAELRSSSRVILVTFDGVRWQDLFDAAGSLVPQADQPAFPFLRSIEKRGALFGDPAQNSSVEVGSAAPVSLPSYQALALGRATSCADNDCPQIAEETVFESVARQLALPKPQVAVFASWQPIARAAARDATAIHIDAGLGAGEAPPPWEEARYDRSTVDMALAALERDHPRLLWISFDDTDEWAHKGEAAATIQALRAADAFLAALFHTIERLPADVRDHTTVIVTTDHGRGAGPLWTTHSRLPEAKRMWLYAQGPYTAPVGNAVSARGPLTLRDVRPTIELLFGLCPTTCTGCGSPIPEVVAGVSAPTCPKP